MGEEQPRPAALYRRTGSMAMGVEAYTREREKELRMMLSHGGDSPQPKATLRSVSHSVST